MKETEVQSLFSLAGFEILQWWRLENRYHSNLENLAQRVEPLPVYEQGKTLLTYPTLEFLNSAVIAAREPWWLVKTKYGLIQIGWRKRVISIDWLDTDIPALITQEDVTKSPTSVHAWTFVKALEYLTELKKQFDSPKGALGCSA